MRMFSDLRKPIVKGNKEIRFMGEHTGTADLYSYSDGAYEMGHKAAKQAWNSW